MLIKAMMTRIDRENMIELSGMGVPIVVTCHASAKEHYSLWVANDTNLTEPRGEGQGLISRQRPSLTRSSGECVEGSADTQDKGDC